MSGGDDVGIRALEDFGSRLDAAMRGHDESTDRAPRRRWFAIAALAGALIAAGLAATPPGRALAERLGELAGIGDEPSSSVNSPVDLPDTVFGVGETPNGIGYEVVANTDHNLVQDRVRETCVSVEFPSTREGSDFSNCLTQSLANSIAEDPLSLLARFGPAELGAERLMVSGIVSTEVASVEVRYEDPDGQTSTYDAEVFPLTGETGAAIDAGDLNYALAFLPSELAPPPTDQSTEIDSGDEPSGPADPGEDPVNEALNRFTAVGFDDSGDEVAQQTLGSYTWASQLLYPPPEDSRAEAHEQAFEECLRALTAERGGPIKPELSEEDVHKLNACAERESE